VQGALEEALMPLTSDAAASFGPASRRQAGAGFDEWRCRPGIDGAARARLGPWIGVTVGVSGVGALVAS
jgi:hypothetical protein